MSMCILCQKWGWWCSWPLRGRWESVCYDVNENDADGDGSRWGVQGDIQAKWRQRQTTSRSPALHWGYHHQHHLITSVCVSESLSICLSVRLCVWSFHRHHLLMILSPSLSSWLIKSISPTSGKFKISVKRIFQGWFLRDRGHHWPRKLRCCQACKAQNHKDWGQFSHFICDN